MFAVEGGGLFNIHSTNTSNVSRVLLILHTSSMFLKEINTFWLDLTPAADRNDLKETYSVVRVYLTLYILYSLY